MIIYANNSRQQIYIIVLRIWLTAKFIRNIGLDDNMNEQSWRQNEALIGVGS